MGGGWVSFVGGENWPRMPQMLKRRQESEKRQLLLSRFFLELLLKNYCCLELKARKGKLQMSKENIGDDNLYPALL